MKFLFLFSSFAFFFIISGCEHYHIRFEPAVARPPRDTLHAPVPSPQAPPLAPPLEAPPPIPFINVERNSVRVFLGNAKESMGLRLTGPYAVYADGKNVGTLTGRVSASVNWRSVALDGRETHLPVTLVPFSDSFLVELNDKSYRGSLLFRLDSLNRPILVNEVSVEDYLKGVVPYEIGKREAVHFEALKVQAIAARTYTYSRLNLHAAQGFDVYPDETDQVYSGTKSQYLLSDSAVDATKDEVITYSDTLIQAYYFSTTPGRTANIEEVWPDKGYRPYLRSVNDSVFCAGSKYFTWKEEWSGDEITRIVNKFGRETFPGFAPGRLQNIAVTERTACGRAKTTLFLVEGREYRVAGDRVRWVLRRGGKDDPILRSACFSLNINHGLTGAIKRVTALGGGYGHGVGLSQMGALKMAEQGMAAEQIIKFYYTGVELKKVKY